MNREIPADIDDVPFSYGYVCNLNKIPQLWFKKMRLKISEYAKWYIPSSFLENGVWYMKQYYQ